MENNAKIYKTSEKQRESTRKYKEANKEKINTKTAIKKLKKFEIEFIIAFIDE